MVCINQLNPPEDGSCSHSTPMCCPTVTQRGSGLSIHTYIISQVIIPMGISHDNLMFLSLIFGGGDRNAHLHAFCLRDPRRVFWTQCTCHQLRADTGRSEARVVVLFWLRWPTSTKTSPQHGQNPGLDGQIPRYEGQNLLQGQ